MIASLLVCETVCMGPEAEKEDDNFDTAELRDLALLHKALKRDVSDRQQEIDAAQQPFYPYGRRTDVPGRPSGFVFGKRGQYFVPAREYQKREMDELNPYSVAKRDEELTGLEDEFQASKRSNNPYGLSGLTSLSFGKRDAAMTPEKRADLFRSYAFGKRALGSSFTFGKRGLSSFDFGKRSNLGSSFAFGKRDDDADQMREEKRALGSSFSFGKRGNGMSSFTFGKRAGER